MEKIGQRLHQVILSAAAAFRRSIRDLRRGIAIMGSCWKKLTGTRIMEDIMYSENGKNWTETSSGDSFSFQGYGVAYGTSNGTSPLWVAVGSATAGGYENIMYSSNGKIWTETSSGEFFNTNGEGVAYGTSDGASPLWVAVGQGGSNKYGNIMYSSDGKEWKKTSSGDSFSINGRGGVAYGTSNGVSPLWVAVGNEGSGGGYGNIMYSENGKIWTETSSGDSFNGIGRGVAYGTSNGTSPLWVAVDYRQR